VSGLRPWQAIEKNALAILNKIADHKNEAKGMWSTSNSGPFNGHSTLTTLQLLLTYLT